MKKLIENYRILAAVNCLWIA